MTVKRILCDLKPALDGYAGIPLETRLLFLGLQQTEHEVHGLLQTDSGYDYSFGKKSDLGMSRHDEIYRSAQAITSFYKSQSLHRGRLASYRHFIRHTVHMQRLLWHVLTNQPINLESFGAEHFTSFIWSRLFSKSLSDHYKGSVCSAIYKFLGLPRSHMHYAGQNGFAGIFKPKYPTLNTSGYDALISQSPFPAIVNRGTKLIVRYHDTIPVFMPHTIENMEAHLKGHFADLRQNGKSGAHFVCVSETTRASLLEIFPEFEKRAHVIHNMVSDQYFPDQNPPEQVNKILLNRMVRVDFLVAAEEALRSGEQSLPHNAAQYILMVSTLEPRKNHENLVRAWEMLRQRKYPDLKLVLVGNVGWGQEEIIKLLSPWMQRGALFHLSNVPANELSTLYQHAAATVCPSLAEGFDYSGVEAMRCGGVVIASDIPVHREVYGDASLYFDPDDVPGIAETIELVLDESATATRERLTKASGGVAQKYSQASLLPQWQELLDKIPQQTSPEAV